MSHTFRQTTALAVILAMAVPQIGLTETSDAAEEEALIQLLKEKLEQDAAEAEAAEDGTENKAPEEAIESSPEETPAEEIPADEVVSEPAADDPSADAEAETPDPESAGQSKVASPDEDEGNAVAIPPEAAADEDSEAGANDTAEDDAVIDAAEAEPEAPAESEDAPDADTPSDAASEDAAMMDETEADEADADTAPEAEDTDAEADSADADALEASEKDAADDHAADVASEDAENSDAKEDLDAQESDEPAEEVAPESREEVLDEAAEQAAEGTGTEAAALDAEDEADDAADEDAEKLTVTEEDARSSSEDFATSIAEAMKPAESRSKDSDFGRDVAKGLLGGLAAYAVGQALTGGGQVALNSGDRVVVTRPDGSQQVLKDDNALLFRPGTEVTTRNYDDGSTRVVVHREDGSSVITIRDAEMRVLRRTLIRPDGTSVALIDETVATEPVTVADLPPAAKPNRFVSLDDEDALRQALVSEGAISRGYSLNQIRNIPGVRALVAPIDIEAITFDTGSAAISPDQARQLGALGRVIAERIRENPNEIFMVEGYTDTVGTDAVNLALSDRRAESLALALTEYFDVPPENMVVQGFGKRFLKVAAEGDIRENRRVAVRRITDLLARN